MDRKYYALERQAEKVWQTKNPIRVVAGSSSRNAVRYPLPTKLTKQSSGDSMPSHGCVTTRGCRLKALLRKRARLRRPSRNISPLLYDGPGQAAGLQQNPTAIFGWSGCPMCTVRSLCPREGSKRRNSHQHILPACTVGRGMEKHTNWLRSTARRSALSNSSQLHER